MEFCPRCGTGILDGMKRCPDCKRPIGNIRRSDLADDVMRPEGKTQARVFEADTSKGKKRSETIKKDRKSVRKWLRVAIAIAVIASAAYSSFAETSDVEITASPEYSPAMSVAEEQYFFDCTTPGESVYADIVSIFPAYKIYEEENVYTHFACECISESGDTLWLYITISDYVSFFDSEAWDSIHSDYADEISFPPRRIHGFTQYADDLIDNFSDDIGSDVLIEFVSAD